LLYWQGTNLCMCIIVESFLILITKKSEIISAPSEPVHQMWCVFAINAEETWPCCHMDVNVNVAFFHTFFDYYIFIKW